MAPIELPNPADAGEVRAGQRESGGGDVPGDPACRAAIVDAVQRLFPAATDTASKADRSQAAAGPRELAGTGFA